MSSLRIWSDKPNMAGNYRHRFTYDALGERMSSFDVLVKPTEDTESLQ